MSERDEESQLYEEDHITSHITQMAIPTNSLIIKIYSIWSQGGAGGDIQFSLPYRSRSNWFYTHLLLFMIAWRLNF